MSTGHAHADGHGEGSKKIGLLIAVLALILAFSETLGKSAQTSALGYNIEAANLWSFFQAKTIRMTTLRTAAEQAELDLKGVAGDGAAASAREKRINAWRKTSERYDSEPETGEGRRQLAARAKVSEAKRDRALAAYHHYETASAAVQIAIVLASAAIITGASLLVWISGALGIVGIAFSAIGFWWPTAIHLF
jgi:plasmid stabilization system protein ParE